MLLLKRWMGNPGWCCSSIKEFTFYSQIRLWEKWQLKWLVRADDVINHNYTEKSKLKKTAEWYESAVRPHFWQKRQLGERNDCWLAAGELLNIPSKPEAETGTDKVRSDLLGEALCDGVVFTPGSDDGHLLGGDPQWLGRPLPAAEWSDGGHFCCESERSICLSAFQEHTSLTLRDGREQNNKDV